MSRLKLACASVGATGHFLPAMALASELHARGNVVVVHSPERWRDVVEGAGIQFWPGEEPAASSGLRPEGAGPELVEIARSLVPQISELGPDVVVTDPFTLAPALAAEAAGARVATLIPDPYHVPERGLPVFAQGLLAPRTALGRAGWRATWPVLDRMRRYGRRKFNELRAELDLSPVERLEGAISDGLAMVATFPQLEYPRRWPGHVHVTGPMLYELDAPDVELPAGDEPLILVAATTTDLDSRRSFVGTVVEALAAEPVRVVATLSRREEGWAGPVPENAAIVDWLSYSRAMPGASLVVCHGGHGTVASALAAGVPVLVCPAGGNTARIGARLAWSGAGLMLPRRLLAPRSLRWAVKRAFNEQHFAARAETIAEWALANSGPVRGADLVERYAAR
jgi:UDP:flavonoid glycosyltransferase YjiC (YdhE family)